MTTITIYLWVFIVLLIPWAIIALIAVAALAFFVWLMIGALISLAQERKYRNGKSKDC